MFKMEETLGSASEAQLSEIEMKYGFSLPADYRNFLISCNGGVPEMDEFEVPGWGVTCIQSFYGIDQEEDYDLESDLNSVLELVPNGQVVPIACDPGGNRICIRVGGANVGHIYFLDHEDEARHLIKLASGFTEFFTNLLPDGTFE